MARRPRRNHSPAFKAKVAVAAIKGEKTLIDLAQEFDLHPNQIKQWRDQLLEGATGVFGDAPKADPEPVIDVKTLHAKIGELTRENNLYEGDSVKGRVSIARPRDHGRHGGLAMAVRSVRVGHAIRVASTYIRQLHDG